MSLKVIRSSGAVTGLIVAVVILVTLAAAWWSIKLGFADDVSLTIDQSRPEARMLAEAMVSAAPSDPQTHFVLASILEKTFDQKDLVSALREYETAAGLSPQNYVLWLNIGRVRGLLGDTQGSHAAYEKALELAPSYAVVQWTYGNALLRDGDTESGFKLIALAAASDPQYARSAAASALDIYDGDADAVRRALGDLPGTNASLAAVLTSKGKFTEGLAAWQRIPPDVRTEKYRDLWTSLLEKSLSAKKFQVAASYDGEPPADVSEKPTIGQVTDGGFESGVKLHDAGPFEWKVGDGVQPQVGLSDSQKRSGRYALVIAFNSADIRDISQTVAVQPGAAYTLEVYYRSDVKGGGALKWEVVDATANSVIASTPALEPAGEWTPVRVAFQVPSTTDGIVIRLSRSGCSGEACSAAGRLLFDDIALAPH